MDVACYRKLTNNAKHVKVRVFEAVARFVILVKGMADFPVNLATPLEFAQFVIQLDKPHVISALGAGVQLALSTMIVQDVVERAKQDVLPATARGRLATDLIALCAMELAYIHLATIVGGVVRFKVLNRSNAASVKAMALQCVEHVNNQKNALTVVAKRLHSVLNATVMEMIPKYSARIVMARDRSNHVLLVKQLVS